MKITDASTAKRYWRFRDYVFHPSGYAMDDRQGNDPGVLAAGKTLRCNTLWRWKGYTITKHMILTG